MTTYYMDTAGSNTSPYDTWAKAATSLQTVADLAVAGDIVYCRGIQTLTAAIDYDINAGSNASGFIKFIGCAADGSIDGTKFILNGDSSAVNCILAAGKSYIWWENFELKNATGSGWDATNAYFTSLVFINCVSHNNGADGWNLYYSDIGKIIFIRCYAYSNSGDGFGQAYRGTIFYIWCISKNNTDGGFDSSTTHSEYMGIYYGCIAHNNGGCGFKNTYQTLFNCISDENDDDGVNVPAGIGLIIGNRLTDNGKDTTGHGINAVVRTLYGWNFLLDNDSGATTGLIEAIRDGSDADTNETSGTEGYNDGANDDFNLTSSATLRRTQIDLSA